MTDPKRWLDDGAPEPVERLLRAAQSERPADAAVDRTLAALGVGAVGAALTSGAAASQGAAAGAAAAASKAGALSTAGMLVAAAKWGAAGIATGAVFLGAVHGVAGLVDAPSKPLEPAAAQAPATPAPVARPAPTAQMRSAEESDDNPQAPQHAAPLAPEPAATRAALPAPRPVEAPATEVISAERLAEEVRIVDRARAALAGGRATDALAALDDYDRLPAGRRFVPETLYLRMEALLRLGQRDAARRVAERLAVAHPNAPQAARARDVLETR
jgi:hypothetical protein